MSDTNDAVPAPDATTAPAPPPYGTAQGGMAPAPAAPVAAYAPASAAGPVGKIRGTGTCILLTIVTLGFYTWYWYYKTHEEMKQHTGTGIGGPVALVLAILVGVV